MKKKTMPKCFGKKHPYIFKCHEWVWKNPKKDCSLVEQCYRKYIEQAITKAEGREV